MEGRKKGREGRREERREEKGRKEEKERKVSLCFGMRNMIDREVHWG